MCNFLQVWFPQDPEIVLDSQLPSNSNEEDRMGYFEELSKKISTRIMCCCQNQKKGRNGASRLSSTSSIKIIIDTDDTDDKEEKDTTKPKHEMSYEEIAIYIDTKARILFPVLFIAFLILYFICLETGTWTTIIDTID